MKEWRHSSLLGQTYRQKGREVRDKGRAIPSTYGTRGVFAPDEEVKEE